MRLSVDDKESGSKTDKPVCRESRGNEIRMR